MNNHYYRFVFQILNNLYFRFEK